MKLLGLRLCEHDSNFSYFDGQTLHYYKSERDKGIKHHGFDNLWEWEDEIYKIWGISADDLDDICIVLDEWKYTGDHQSFQNFSPATEVKVLNTCLYGKDRINHHFAHALSMWPLSPTAKYDVVIDGFGEFDISWSVFSNHDLVLTGSKSINGSLGLLMCEVGRDFFGLGNNCHGLDIAGKLMGLQAYGMYDTHFARTLDSYTLDDADTIFDFQHWINRWGDEDIAYLKRLDWVHTVHEVIGDKLVDFFKTFAQPDDNITYSGGVAQNVVWNTKIKKHFPNLITPPHCNDDGLSLGAVEWLRRKYNLPEFTLPNWPYIVTDEGTEVATAETVKQAARLLAQGSIVGWYQNNGEVGPRALGNRSILCDPRLHDAKWRVNQIKRRENYRPFGASILESHTEQYFSESFSSPYMLYLFEVNGNDLDSVRHIDNTCRIQTVNENQPIFYALLDEFYKLTGCPLLLNTSLNVSGKGIAGSRRDAKSIFFDTPLDALFIGNTCYTKNNSEYPTS